MKRPGTRRRIVPGATLVAVFLALSTLFLSGNTAIYRGILSQMGFHPFDFPFLDMHGVLATAECARRGIDVIVSNPCDVLGRTLDYSPFWLVTAHIGLNTGMTMPLGLLLDIVFIVSVFFLPPAKTWGAIAVLIAALLSSAVTMALERANLDLAVFVIGMIVASWSLRGPVWRSMAYGLITLVALVKYYPGIMLLLALRERWRFLLPLAAALLAAGALLVWIDGTMLMRALHNIDTREFPASFGALNLPRHLAELLVANPDPLARIVELFLALLAGGYAYIVVRRGDHHDAMQALAPRDRNLLLLGCALILGCFFTAENAPYRDIYFLFILCGLDRLSCDATRKAARRRLALLTGAILFLMWEPFFHLVVDQSVAGWGLRPAYPTVYLYLREAIWWWVVGMMLALAFDAFRTTAIGAGLSRQSSCDLAPTQESV